MIKQRIIQFINNKGVSKYNFYKKTGFSNGSLDKKGTIGADKCEIIYSYYPELNLEWLITGKGEMLREKASSVESKNKSIPFYDIRNINNPNRPLLSLEPNYFVDFKLFNNCLAFVPIIGNNIAPLFLNGEIVGLEQPSGKYINYGEIHLIKTSDNFLLFRKIKKHPDDDKVIMASISDDYDDNVILKKDIAELFLIKKLSV